MEMGMETYDMELISSAFSKKEYDFFILAPNIEKRSRAFFTWSSSKISCKRYILANYENFHIGLSTKQEETFFDDFGGCPKAILDVNDDESLFLQMSKLGVTEDSKIGLDISGFSVPAVYSLLFYFKNICRLHSLDVYYTEPENYVYEEGYFDSYHPANIYRKCAPIIGYQNSGRDQREILTIFLGFDGGLADLVYGKLGEEGKEIIRKIVVNGFPSYTAKLKDVSLYNNETLIDKLDKSDRMTTTANNPFDTYNLLCLIKKESDNVLMNVCTIGSKPMALGACLFALNNIDNVKVTYPYYTKTKFDISEQPGKMWRYGIYFDAKAGL